MKISEKTADMIPSCYCCTADTTTMQFILYLTDKTSNIITICIGDFNLSSVIDDLTSCCCSIVVSPCNTTDIMSISANAPNRNGGILLAYQ